MDEEIWVDLHGAEEYYQVSSHGRVWRKERVVLTKNGQKRRYKAKIVTFNSVDMEGYYCLYLRIDGKRINLRLHRAVALSFLGEPPEDKPLVRHLDGNKLNNRLDNLVWGSVAENGKDASEHGTVRNRKCDTVKFLFGKLIDHGVSATQVGHKLGITSHTVRQYLKKHRKKELVT